MLNNEKMLRKAKAGWELSKFISEVELLSWGQILETSCGMVSLRYPDSYLSKILYDTRE